MAGLILELKAGDSLILRGEAPQVFSRKTTVKFQEQASFLFGKQILKAEEVDSPEKEIYFEIQTAYVGLTKEIRKQAFENASNKIDAYTSIQSTAYKVVKDTIVEVGDLLRAREYYPALTKARKLIDVLEKVARANRLDKRVVSGANQAASLRK